MATESILAQIDAEIAKLVEVRKLLSRTGLVTSKGIARAVRTAAGRAPKKRVLSADARKRIADAQRKRWAAQKSKNKKEA